MILGDKIGVGQKQYLHKSMCQNPAYDRSMSQSATSATNSPQV